MSRLLVLSLLVGLAGQAEPRQGPGGSTRRFEAASVKVHPPGDGTSSMGTAINTNLDLLISAAYDIPPWRLEGVPRQMKDVRFDVVAVSDGPSTEADKQLMLQQLLAERFKLAIGRENVEEDVYALRLDRADGRLGPSIKRSSDECSKAAELSRTEAPSVAPVPEDTWQRCFSMQGLTGTLPSGLQVKGRSMSWLVAFLGGHSKQTIHDQTDLDGVFDFQLLASLGDLLPPRGTRTGPAVDTLPSIFTALREQLGLRLEKQRGLVPKLVVTHVEMPKPD
jgi:uncharacterized protein (TIGR03435 family)